MCVYVCVCGHAISHSMYVGQGASREAFGQKTLKVGGPLDGKQEQLHLDLLRPRSHHLGQLHPETASYERNTFFLDFR